MIRKMIEIKKIWMVCAGLLLAAIVILSTIRLKNNGEILFYVDNSPVYKEELLFRAEELRLGVRNTFIKAHGIAYEEFEWDRDYGGGDSALDTLIDQAVAKSAYYKLLHKQAQKVGILKKIDYPALAKQKKQENQSRQEKLDSQEIVYGTEGFSDSQYYDYLNRNLEFQVQTKLAENQTIRFLDGELEELYEEHAGDYDQESFEAMESNVKIMGIRDKFDQYMNDMLAKADIKIKNVEVVRNTVENNLG